MFRTLNPSKADANKDDQTGTKCVHFAKIWADGGVVVGNLFALWSTDPGGLLNHHNPAGPKKDFNLQRLADECDMVVDLGELCQ